MSLLVWKVLKLQIGESVYELVTEAKNQRTLSLLKSGWGTTGYMSCLIMCIIGLDRKCDLSSLQQYLSHTGTSGVTAYGAPTQILQYGNISVFGQ